MPVSTRYLVQAFEHVDGRLVPTLRRDAPSEGLALRQAEALAGRLPGAAALKLVSHGTAETTTILGAFGDVPDDLSDGLAGG